MSNEIFQKIFDILNPTLPTKWKKMIFYVAYYKGSYSMKYYTSDKEVLFTDCFSQKGANKAMLIKIFININKMLMEERNALADKDKWSVMTMIVDSNGSIKAEFDYTDISEEPIEYEKKWKETYII